ncbi:MAG: FAD:protein FMN transferase [Campylobacterota bacterium]|nr:FAD:protein FMN transferase [Campylobacterota bacterium]
MRYLYKFEVMTTECEVTLITLDKSKADACAKAILSEAKRLEKKYNYYNPSSYLSQINQRQIDKLDSETKSILQRALRYYKLTDRIFDITVATVKDLYTQLKDKKTLHVKKNELLKYVGCEHIKIKKERISFDNEFTKIDLGGFVKELAVDNAIKIIKKAKITSALVNFGGDIYALGRREDGNKFRVGIKNPRNPSEHIEYFELENEALTTSASYERNYKIEDEIYSHIISTQKSEKEVESVTVISNSCVESGVYSTALMLNPKLQTKNHIYII